MLERKSVHMLFSHLTPGDGAHPFPVTLVGVPGSTTRTSTALQGERVI